MANGLVTALTSYGVLGEIALERVSQDEKWGQQNHPNGTEPWFVFDANQARAVCDNAAKRGELTWRHILTEEFYEALAETDPAKLRAELVQVAAVAVNWIECIDRNA